jgi:hypothetical protein
MAQSLLTRVKYVKPSPNPNKLEHPEQTKIAHIRLGILVGAGIQQQPRAFRTTFVSCLDQRCPPVLRGRVFSCHTSNMHIATRTRTNANAKLTTLKTTMITFTYRIGILDDAIDANPITPNKIHRRN